MTKKQIITASEEIFSAFTHYCNSISEASFFAKPAAKWSVAENVVHLVTATNTSTLAFTLPKFIVGWIGGKPNRQSRSYEQLVAKYKQKLAEGGAANGRFIPKPVSLKSGKVNLIYKWNKAAIKHLAALKKFDDNYLDSYLVKHPLLGRITLRELCYFNIYHTQHHLNSIASTAAQSL